MILGGGKGGISGNVYLKHEHKGKNLDQCLLSTGTGTYCNSYATSLKMRGADFYIANKVQETAGLSFSKF